MSQVLTSHSEFKKLSDPAHIELPKPEPANEATISNAEDAASTTNPPSLTSDDPELEEVDGSSDDEDVSISALEEELERADVDPYSTEYATDVEVEAYTSAEAKSMRELLRNVGANRFIEQCYTKDQTPIRKLVTAFGVHPNLPYSESWYCRILGLAIQRELSKRQKLPQYNTVDDAVSLLKSSKNIMVITGAGISTSLGIPDFRSKNTGFYSQLLARGFDSPEDIFDIHNFDDDPSHFYTLAKEILPVTGTYSPTHAFIRALQDKDKLLTNYTQNIDNVEACAGISPAKLIQCHGSWATASCRKCQHQVVGSEIFEDVRSQRVSRCKRCTASLSLENGSRKRKRGDGGNGKAKSKSSFSDSEDEGQYDVPEAGVMKPDITFFGEKLPDKFFDRLTEHDAEVVDLMIVIGTSMKVAPVSEIPNYISQKVPAIYISKEPATHINFDITLLGYCDEVVAELCRRAEWKLDHVKVQPDLVADVEAANEIEGQWFIKAGLAKEEAT